MNYITNEAGEIKVIDKTGKTKYVSKIIAENAKVMRNTGLTVMEAPQSFSPSIEAVSEFQEEFSSEGAELAEPVVKESKKVVKKK